MNIMSFNCKGLSSPLKRSTLQWVVKLEHPDMIMLQETLGLGDVVKGKLESWFSGWQFETLDVRGHSRGLAMGWNTRVVKVLNIWGMDSILGMTFKGLDQGEPMDSTSMDPT